jgi:hypothetical protein
VGRNVSSALRHLAAAAAVAALGACADGDGFGGDPGATPLAVGQSCGSVRQELDSLDRKGTQAKVEAASQGKTATTRCSTNTLERAATPEGDRGTDGFAQSC